MPVDLFVSYARTDRDRVLPWAKRLRQAGLSLWIDEVDIDAAHLWTQEITEALDACRALLLLLSPASAASRQVAREVALASEGNTPILPLLLEPTTITGSLRYHLADVHHLELSDADPEASLVAILRALARLGVVPREPEEPGGEAAETPTPARAAPPPPERASNNLSQPLTRFIGREREIATVTERLAGARLLTLTGAGGTGKTRLALQVAGELRESYSGGVWLVELAALTDPSLVPQAVGRAVGVREEPGRPLLETLIDALRRKTLLLVLDNCEHLVAACAELAHALLRACPEVRLLATSRQALGVPGESLFRVPPLAVPKPPPPPLEQLTRYDAVRLFVDRALLVEPSFAVTAANAPAVASVCHRLDGIPLALELAAARVNVLSVEQLVARLEDRLRLLTGGSRMTLPRQQTLRATLDWSYDLLSEAERVLLHRLSVFDGGWSLEAAEAVCADPADGRQSPVDSEDGTLSPLTTDDGLLPSGEVLDRLTQLAEKSLVLVEAGEGEARYRLLETIREYGAEKLERSGEAAALRSRHRDWYLALAEQAEPELRGPAQGEWLSRLEVEHENLRAALAGSIERGEAEAGLRLGGAMLRFWFVRGYPGEGREWLERLLSLPGAESRTAARARALDEAGGMAQLQKDYVAARAHYEESQAIQQELVATGSVPRSLTSLGSVAYEQGDYATAGALLEESLNLCRARGEKRGMGYALNHLGNVECTQGNYDAARAFHEESLAIWRELGDKACVAISLNNLGNVACERGVPIAARALQQESLAISVELGSKLCISASLEGLAPVEARQSRPDRATRLLGAAITLREAMGMTPARDDQARAARVVTAARQALGEEAFAAAWAQGRALSLEQAIALALQEPTPPTEA